MGATLALTFPVVPRWPFGQRAEKPLLFSAVNPAAELDVLLASVGRGDRSAFERLYDDTAAMVYGLALRVLRSPSLAEDVAQEVYLQIWKQADRFDSARAPARAWIATLAHRRAVDAVRRNQTARDREQGVSGEIAEPDPAETAVERDEASRLASALSRLSDLQRQVIELAYFGGLTQNQVAERLGAPLGTVKTRMRDGLLRLRSIMGDEDG
jgi:RNA polymerase sigma-70 factor (ECF subfamily)